MGDATASPPVGRAAEKGRHASPKPNEVGKTRLPSGVVAQTSAGAPAAVTSLGGPSADSLREGKDAPTLAAGGVA